MIINESKLNESNKELINLIKSGSESKLIKYLASLGDDVKIIDPNDNDTMYHKASNGVKSGWGEYRNGNFKNGQRVNVTLLNDTQVAKDLLHSAKSKKESINESNFDYNLKPVKLSKQEIEYLGNLWTHTFDYKWIDYVVKKYKVSRDVAAYMRRGCDFNYAMNLLQGKCKNNDIIKYV